MEYVISNKMAGLEGSAIRAVLKMSQGKDLITFAGGLPALETLPVKFISDVITKALAENPGLALMYGVTDGYDVLISRLIEKMQKMGVDMSQNGLMVTSGGQQVIDLAAKTLLNEGDTVVCEAPTFVGGLNVFKSYNAKPVTVEMGKDGLDLDQLEALLKTTRVKLLYTIPTFQNPTGVTMPLENRKRLLELASKYDFIIIEDNPYGELRFSGQDVPTIKSLDTEGRVIYAGSFSKILSPGLRVGWGVGPKPIIEKMVVAKQVVDVHTTMLAQIVAAELLADPSYDTHIENCRNLYRKKCKLMMDCIDKEFPDTVSRTNPEGGLFLWCTIKGDVDTVELLEKAVEKKVAFIPGYTFMVDTSKKYNTFRLNYSTTPEADIIKGIHLLGSVLKEL